MSHYDFIIIGSGFGGSVSAMRLAQKGYNVAIIEAGRRWRDKDFPVTNWNLRRSFWLPRLFCYGIQRITHLRNVMVLSGAGVGGGSLVYANTLYIPGNDFFNNKQIKKLGGKSELLPYFKLAGRMLGVIKNPHLGEVDRFIKETAAEMGHADTFTSTPVGVFFGKEGKTFKDPYFSGEGPDRTGCNFCGGCMVGCRYNSKNTLEKNYLYFAEKLGADIIPETKISEVIPLSADGEKGYEIRGIKTTGIFNFRKKIFHAQNVIFSAGVLGTLNLLLKMKEEGYLPRLSDFLGKEARTNSEALIGVTSRNRRVDYSHGIAISSSVHPDTKTHIEPVRYSRGSDTMGFLMSLLTDGGGLIPRQLRFLFNIISHPLDFARILFPLGFAKKTIILLVMQTVDNSLRLLRKHRFFWPFNKSLTSEPGTGRRIPTYIPIAHKFARLLGKKINAIPRGSIFEALLDIPTTAHILGGACIGKNREEGVVDKKHRVFGYKNMFICDGSIIPANLGVNPSLSITAFTERAISFIPAKSKPVYFKFEKKWKVTSLLNRKDRK